MGHGVIKTVLILVIGWSAAEAKPICKDVPGHLEIPSYKIDPKFPVKYIKQLQEDLSYLASIQGKCASPLHYKIFGGPVNGKIYVNWLFNRVRKIKYLDDKAQGFWSKFKPPQTLYAQAKGDTMWLGENWFQRTDRVVRLSTLLHEARHLEGDQWDHVVCRVDKNDDVGMFRFFGEDDGSDFGDNDLVGKPSCDNSEMSAHSINMIVSNNIKNFCINCDLSFGEKYSLDLFIQMRFSRIIGREARLKLKEDIFYQDIDTEALKFAIRELDDVKLKELVSRDRNLVRVETQDGKNLAHVLVCSPRVHVYPLRAERILKILGAFGLNLAAKDKYGKTAFDYSVVCKAPQLSQLLLSAK